MVLVVIATGMLLVGGLFGVSTLLTSSSEDEDVTLEMALAALDGGHYSKAKGYAEALRESGDLPPDALGGPAFVAGAATAHEAEDDWRLNKKRIHLLAARYLEEARDRGFPPSRKTEGLFLLGSSLYHSGQFGACRQPLLESLRLDENRKSAVLNLLAESSFRDANPKLEEALKYNSQYLADRRLSPESRAQATLRQSRILFRLGRTEDCRTTLALIPVGDPLQAEAVLLSGRLVLNEARRLRDDKQRIEAGTNIEQAVAKYREAKDIFARAQGLGTIANETTPKAMFLTGMCFYEMYQMGVEKPAPAKAQLQQTRKRFTKTSEGLAANLLEGDLERQVGNSKASVAAYLRALEAVEDPRLFSNSWFSLNEFRQRVRDAHRHFVSASKFEEAMAMLEKFPPTFDRIAATELLAETEHEWGMSLLQEAAPLEEKLARPILQAGRKHLRKAGFTHARLAKMRITTRQYPEDLWNSADNLLLGQDFISARNILTMYLENESRSRRPQALVSLGKTYLALGENVKALEALRDCIEYYPRDAAIYEARIWCSKAYREVGASENAQKLLLKNLTADLLTPSSAEWQESLFLLGRYLHEQGQLLFDEGKPEEAARKHMEAIEKLEEAVTRYPNSPHVIDGLYTIAESHRLAAREPETKLGRATIESARRAYRYQIREHLTEAHKYYAQVQAKLNQLKEESELNELQETILRNCYMSLGSVLAHLGRYEEPSRYEQAIKAYENASARYQNEPIVLEAYVQMAHCYRRLNRAFEARGTLAQAHVVMNRLNPDVPFDRTTNYTRQEWEDLLAQLSKW